MKSFRTELSVVPSPISLQLSMPVFTIGSCFSDAIGNLLERHKFNTAVNPLGVIFNPVSIHKALRYTIHNEPAPDHTYLENQGLWSNYDFHSSFSGLTKQDVQKKIINTIGSAHYFLSDARFLIITYGTGWVFERTETGELVANCHKVPSFNFKKRLLTVDEISASFDELYSKLRSFNPELKIILSVSPVRHVRDTLELNAVSKSVLRLATYRISENHPEVDYFPAYEIMMDDLRDYRFYAADMLHPSEEAILYIWEKFSERYFDAGVRNFINMWHAVYAALHHNAFHPEGEPYKKFLADTLTKLEELKSFVHVDQEIKFIHNKLSRA